MRKHTKASCTILLLLVCEAIRCIAAPCYVLADIGIVDPHSKRSCLSIRAGDTRGTITFGSNIPEVSVQGVIEKRGNPPIDDTVIKIAMARDPSKQTYMKVSFGHLT